jgi:hypothetical protein
MEVPAGPDPEATPTSFGPFRSAETCGTCHPQHLADWEASMHAYAASDPLMIRMAEMADAESGGGAFRGDDCRRCHGPAQHRQNQWLATLPPGFDPFLEDLTQDGVNCDVCHSVQIVPPVGSIDYLDDVDPDGPKLAGIADPVPNEFHESRRDNSYVTSINCAPCHQVNLPDGTGIENTYTEWSRSSLSGLGNTDCQDCHMPAEIGPAAVGGPDRTIHRHTFVGVDYALEPFRGIDRDAQQQRVADLLQNSVSVTADVPTSVAAGSTLDVALRVVNDRTGHAIPSGTSFSREMWIEVRVLDGKGATLYHSGALAANGDLVEDADLEWFGSIATDASGARTFFTWRMAAIDESRLLQHGGIRDADYPIDVPAGTTGPLTVETALRFRPLRPEILRLTDLEQYLPIRVFPMWEDSRTVAVTPAP